MSFFENLPDLPYLGIGISTEYGISLVPGAFSYKELRSHYPQYAEFLEVGVTADLGIDEMTENWIQQNLPTTYHFLDLNLGDPEDFDEQWISKTLSLLSLLKPAWICGDAGQWHFNRREPAHGFLQPPILSKDSAREIADGIIALREISGLEVFPENPPGISFVGDLHLLDFFALVCELADTGMVLDCTHLWMFQHSRKLSATTGLENFPAERIIELHVAGSSNRQQNGFYYIEDDHKHRVLPETWEIFEDVCRQGKNIRAIALEAERNLIDDLITVFENIKAVSDKYDIFKGISK